MDDFADALERGVEFFRFETKQRYTRGVFAVRQEILRLQAMRESRKLGRGPSAARMLLHNKLCLLKRRSLKRHRDTQGEIVYALTHTRHRTPAQVWPS